MDATYNIGNEPQHEAVYYQGEESKGNNIDGQGKEKQEGTDDGVHDSQEERCNKRSSEGIDGKAGRNTTCHQEYNGT